MIMPLLDVEPKHSEPMFEEVIEGEEAGGQFNRKSFGLSFGLKNGLGFGLRFPVLRKSSKMGSLDISQNQNGTSIRFSSRNSSQIVIY